jgi:hypothetical protein
VKAICLVVVDGGVAYTYAPEHVDVQLIDLDNIDAGDPPTVLPRGVGFEKLVEEAGLSEGTYFVWEAQP